MKKQTDINRKSFTYLEVFFLNEYIKTMVLISIRMYFRERPFYQAQNGKIVFAKQGSS